MRFYCDCVNWPTNHVHTEGGLCDMCDNSTDITRRTFLQHVDRDSLRDIEKRLGYAKHWRQWLTMAGDWHVRYFRSKLYGATVYGFVHSSIEYVFTEGGTLPQTY